MFIGLEMVKKKVVEKKFVEKVEYVEKNGNLIFVIKVLMIFLLILVGGFFSCEFLVYNGRFKKSVVIIDVFIVD